MQTLEFRYTNLVPPAARPGTNTNEIRVWRDGDTIKYDRRYVCKDGSVNDTGIEHTFEHPHEQTAENIARNIHWGCCGWDAGLHQIWQLRDRIADWLGTKIDTDSVVKHHRTVSLDGFAQLAYLRARFAMSRDEAIEVMRKHNQDMSFLETDTDSEDKEDEN